MTTVLLLLTLFSVVLTALLLTSSKPLPTYYRTKWKKPVQLYYTDPNKKGAIGNILTIYTKDLNSKDYYHAINDPGDRHGPDPTDPMWYNHPSRTPIKDKELIDYLNKCYQLVLNGKYQGGGWVKDL